MKNNEMMRMILIIVAACVFIYLIHSYNNNMELENFYDNGDGITTQPPNNIPELNNSGKDTGSENESENESDNESDIDIIPPGEKIEEAVTFKTVPQKNDSDDETENNVPNKLPNECYPKDTLTPQDLLPQDANSTWSQTVPSGQGSLGDQNFLNAGFHVGINTVGQSLRNSNLQLRSEPSNPQIKVSPWSQSTIEPDVNRRALEIGCQ